MSAPVDRTGPAAPTGADGPALPAAPPAAGVRGASPASDSPAGTQHRTPVTPLVAGLGVLAALAALVAAVLAPRTVTLLADPGTLTRWGLPAVEGVHHLALALTVGALVMAVLVLPVGSPAAARATQVATGAGAVWTLAAVGVLVLTYASVSGTPPTAPAFGDQLAGFLTGFSLGQSLLVTVLLAAAATTVAAAATGPRSTALATALALAALLPIGLTGHSGSAEGHETAVTAMGLHLVGTAVWVGGLLTLVLLRPVLRGPQLQGVVARFSGLALASVVLVSFSGVMNASTRLSGPADLGSRYGLLLVAKVALVAVLVAAGWWHRRALLPALGAERPRAFWRLVVVELLVMATTTGVSVALSGTTPPVSDSEPPPAWSSAEVLVGASMPPEQTLGRLVTLWRPDLLWVLVTAGLAVAYLLGVRRLHRRGDRWPLWRTLLWLTGLAVVLAVTSSGLATYGRVLFSTHMLQHMSMSMVAPLLLVPAAPVTLALRTITPRRDGSRGPREWLLWGLHTPVSRTLTHPVVAAGIFTGSLMVFYYSPLFGLALSTHYGHEAMFVHFLLSGYLFVWSLVGTDPGVRPTPYPLRLIILLATMAFHAFFAVTLMGSTTLLEPFWFETVAAGRGWGEDPLADQRYGAALAWAVGEVPTIVLAVLVAVRWVTDDSREARRRDRRADRDGEADLAAHNEMFAALARQDADRQAPTTRSRR
ncbi:cytochrome c oxidase assembly protein [Aquipuribacter hungaricus]|uniref:cytochrome c oxidase assembly protein n=1 Tax=Aquipuribacter hungaricus TaxID=545624 RepID=UPI003606E3AA